MRTPMSACMAAKCAGDPASLVDIMRKTKWAGRSSEFKTTPLIARKIVFPRSGARFDASMGPKRDSVFPLHRANVLGAQSIGSTERFCTASQLREADPGIDNDGKEKCPDQREDRTADYDWLERSLVSRHDSGDADD